VLREKLPGLSLTSLQEVTGAQLVIPEQVGDLVAPEV